MEELHFGLNPEQRRVVDHVEGPLLVLAGPGSGKTRVITGHIARRLSETAAVPQRILAITFTNRAAAEMRQRVGDLVGLDVPVRIGTFHWTCNAFLRRYSPAAGFHRPFRLLGPREAHSVLRTVTSDAEPPGLSQMAHAVSAVKNGSSLAEASRIHGIPEATLTSIREKYDTRLRSLVALDLDDLLVCTCALLREQDRIREAVRRRFDVILVDEFQDTNPVQAAILQLLSPPSDTVIAVGDDDQAIYGWRQAAGGATLYRQCFPDAEVVELGESYRHSKLVLRAAASLITRNAHRESKHLRTARPAGARPISFTASSEMEEAAWVVSKVESIHGSGEHFEDMAVLFRINAQSRVIEDVLLRRGIPYRVLSGRRFYEQPEIQTVVAYLRLALDDSDDEAAAILALRIRGFGDTRRTVLRRAADELGSSLLRAMTQLTPDSSIPGPVQARLKALASRVRAVCARREQALDVLLEHAISAARPDLEAGSDDHESLNENLGELRSLVREFDSGRGTLPGLIDRLAIQSDVQAKGQGVSLLTLHAAKGLEFSTVFLVGMEEGLLPHRRAMDREIDIEEERRLCYVGVTRARDRLFLTHALARFLGGQALAGEPSRFLREMGRHNLAHERLERVPSTPRLKFVQEGEIVSHSRWGRGTVISIEGRGRDTLTIIHFDSVGRQRLQLCHAPLVRVTGQAAIRAG